MLRMIVVGAGLAVGMASALAQQAGDPDRGHAYAVMTCAPCHSIEKGGAASPNPNAPVWRDIANMPGITATALRVFLSTPHQQMPDLVISPANMQDLIAYILTLQKQPAL